MLLLLPQQVHTPSFPTIESALFLITGSRTTLFILAPCMKVLFILLIFGVEVTVMLENVEEYLGAGIFGLVAIGD